MLDFEHDDDRSPGRPVPMPRLDGPRTGVGRRIMLPSTGVRRPDTFRFSGSVGLGGDNFRDDVIKAQVLLGNSGDYDLASLGAPTGWPGGELWRGIRRYQKRKGLAVDGILLPLGEEGGGEDGAGETLSALRNDLGDVFTGRRVPTPEEVDRHYEQPDRSDANVGQTEAQPEIALREDSGALPQYPLGTVSDVDVPPSVEWHDGAQVAQAVPVQSLLVPPPLGTTGSTPQSPYPHERPEVKAAGRQLERIVNTALGNAAGNLSNLHDAAQAAWAEGKNREPRLSDADLAAFTHMPGDIPTLPSGPITEADKAATRTPPLIPPKVDDRLQGRPAEEQEAYVEKLISPEMKDWYEGLEPFDQRLARQLLVVMNRRGDDTTQLGNAIFVKKYLEVFEKEFGHIRGKIKHVGGARDENGNSVPEELLRDTLTEGVKGGSWADISLQFVNHITEAMYKPHEPGQRNRINTQTMQKSRPVPIAKERKGEANLRRNAKGEPVVGFPKLRPDLPGGQSSDAAQAQYAKDVEEFALQNIPAWMDFLRKGGFL